VVDVSDAPGGSAADIQRVARNTGYWPFRLCYEEGLRRDQGLAGKVSLELSIAPTGEVEQASPTATTLRDEMVVACVAREARRLSLPSGPTPVTARMQVLLATGDEPVPVAHPVAGASELRAALRSSWPAVEQCYTATLGSHPDAGGRMELRFRVSEAGEVLEVTEGPAHFGEPDAARCVAGVYKGRRLPAARAASEGPFVYAMHIEQKPVMAAPRDQARASARPY
jgi:hypothetical protein